MTVRLTAIILLGGVCLMAQPRNADRRRADIRGGGDHGKCTIEVVVDGVAEVAIRGDSAELRTLNGQRAEWRRFVCNQPMPANPTEFRFSGIDGRGRQELVREPGRGEPAVVRIEDPQSGREGYTFDLEWRGDGGGGGGWEDRGPRRDRDGPRREGGPWRDDNPRGGGWTGRMGSEFQYRGDGRGMLNRRNGPDTPVRDVVVNLNRDGDVAIEFEARGFDRIVFTGRATRISDGTVVANLNSNGRERETRGSTVIYMNPGGQVERVTMNGRIDGDPFKLDWSAR